MKRGEQNLFRRIREFFSSRYFFSKYFFEVADSLILENLKKDINRKLAKSDYKVTKIEVKGIFCPIEITFRKKSM